MNKHKIWTVVGVITALLCGHLAFAGYISKVHSNGPDKMEVESGGEIEVKSGGTLDIQAGATVTIGDGLFAVGDFTVTEGYIVQGNSSDVGVLIDAGADGYVLIGDGTDLASVAISGDIAITNTGAATIATGAVEDSMIEGLAAGQIILGVDGTAANNLIAVLSGDVTMSGSGAVTIATGAVEDSMIEGLAAGQIILGVDGTAANNLISVLSGDVTMSATGAVTIATGAVEDSMIEGLAAGQIILGVDGTAANNLIAVLSGDVTMSGTGAVTISAKAVEDTMISAGAGTVLVGTKTDVDVTLLDNSTAGSLVIGQGAGETCAANVFSGDATMAAGGAVTLTADTVWSMPVLGTWAIDGDAVYTDGAGLSGDDPTTTEQAVGYCKTYDASNAEYVPLATSSSGTDVTNDYQFFSDTKSDNDAVYFGGAVPFPEFGVDMSATVQNYTGDALTWEYWNGAWVALTIVYDGTDATAQDGLRSFGRDGAISFIPPSDWVSYTVDSQDAYWVRARISTTANIGVNEGQTNSKEHELVTPTDGFECPQGGTITRIRLSDGASTLHTTADVKFILVNFTTGATSGELTFAQDKRSDSWGSLTLSVADGDKLGVVVTQEDTGNEVTNPVLDLHVTLQ